MSLGNFSLNRTRVGICALIAASALVTSCNSYKAPGTNGRTSKLKFRVFVSNPLLPVTGGTAPVLNIVDALKDLLSPAAVSVQGSSQNPGLMALSPNLARTMVFSASGNTIVVVDNSTEAIAQTTVGSTPTSVPTITLPGPTESMMIGPDNVTGYAAVPTAPMTGQSPGAVEVLDLQQGAIKASIPVPGAHFIVLSPDGNHILVFSDDSDTVTVISTIFIGTNSDPRSYITGFDRPVWAVFSDSGTAYVLNCGPECNGLAAGVAVLTDLPAPGTTAAFGGTTIPVSGATMALLSGSVLYVTGTPPDTPCGTGTAATNCGRLTLIDTGSNTATGSAIITNGRHDRMALSQNGQLFIGAHDCTNINTSTEVRGCLSIFNSSISKVIVPPQNGDVTGIQPIRDRNVVYVAQNRGLSIYDTTTDTLQVTQVDIIGDAVDVKLVN